MRRVIDLDDAERVIARIRGRSMGERMQVGPTAWRDEDREFDDGPLETLRSRVRDPFSLTVHLLSPDGDQVGGIVVFRGGWADAWVLADGRIEDDSIELETV